MKRKYYWPIIVIVLFGLAGLVYLRLVSKVEVLTIADLSTPTRAKLPATPGAPASQAIKSGKKPAVQPTQLSYAEALQQYGKYRIQLDPNCAAIPNRVTFANGTDFLLDNRSAKERTVLFNLKTYKIPAYGFVVIKAQASSLPAVTFIDCDQQQNVATISIQ